MSILNEEEKQHESEGESEAQGEQSDQGDGVAEPKKSKLKLIIALVALLVLISAGAIFWHMHKSKAEKDAADTASETEHSGEAKDAAKVFVDVEPFIVNLNTGGKGVSFLKLKIKLELKDAKDKEAIDGKMPKIRDTFQLYLRELRPVDMQGSVGLYRLREELLLRVNKLSYPVQIEDILFDDVLVQ